MVKLIVLIKRKQSLTPEQFRTHYETVHANLALEYIRPYLVDYRRNYPVSSFSYFDAVEESGKAAQRTGYDYDCITEMWLADSGQADAMMARLAEPAVRKAIGDDEDRFIDSKSVVMITCEEHRSKI